MDTQALQKIKDTIGAAQQLTIAVTANPSIDQMAAALSLFLILESQGKKVQVVSPTEPIVELSSLVGIDKVKTSSEGSTGDLVVSFPYREGEIEKVSYTIEDGALNIVVKASEAGLTFDEQDVRFKRGSDKPELLFTVGVSRLSQIEGIFPQDMLQGVTVINLDNNVDNEGFGAMVLVSPKFSSLSEQLADLMMNLGFDIDIDASQNLLSGIIDATNNFQSQNTSYLAFEVASILLKGGAVRPAASRSQHHLAQQEARISQTQPQRQMQQGQSRQQQNRDDRQNRRDAIREALRNQSQSRINDQRQDSRRDDRPVNDQRQDLRRDDRPVQSRQQQPQQVQSNEQKPPSDWLTPKVYKGSTSV